MPLNIDMGFPIITWDLGLSSDTNAVRLRSLFDSCGCANVGRLDYHLWIISRNPEIVAEFRFYDSHQPFDPISLDGVVTNPSDLKTTDEGLLSENHGLLTAIVRYRTPYLLPDKSPLCISYGLGENVSTNTLTGLPLIKALAFLTDYGAFQAYSPVIKQTFPLETSPGQCGLPPNVTFNVTEFRKQYDQQLSVRHSTNISALSASEQARHHAFFSPSLLTSIDDTSGNYLCRRVVPCDTPNHQ
jgi:hypothetical protein